MIKIKIIYNNKYIEDDSSFQNKIVELQKKYNDSCIIELSNDVKLDLMIDNKLVYTLDDNFTSQSVPTSVIIEKIDQHIYSAKSSKRAMNTSKYDDIGLIDY